jgi:hypothetical protein
MKRTTLTAALVMLGGVMLAGTATAQPSYYPATNSTPLTPPSVQAGSVSTSSGLPPASGAPVGAGTGAFDQVAPPLAAGSAALPGNAEQPTTERGANPGQGGFPNQTLAPSPGLAVATPPPASAAIIPEPPAPTQTANAPGSENAVRLILADGYKSPQGVTRGPDGRWRGKALRGTTLVDVSVDGRGNVTSP